MKVRARAILRLAIVPIIISVALLVAWRFGYFDLDRKDRIVDLMNRVRGTWWGGPVYVAAYVLVIALGLPATLLTILGGAMFGFSRGLLFAWSGAMIGTIVTHWVARTIGKGPVKRIFGNHKLLRELRKRADVWMLVRLRVLPVAPFGVLDYVAGLAGVPLRTLLIATGAGILPSMAAYAYVGQQVATGLLTGGGNSGRAVWIAGAITAISGRHLHRARRRPPAA